MFISSRFGSTIRLGRSTVSSFVKKACSKGCQMICQDRPQQSQTEASSRRPAARLVIGFIRKAAAEPGSLC